MRKNYFLFSIFTLFSFLTYAQGPWNFNGSNDIWVSTGTAANLSSGASFSTLDVNGAGNPMLRTSSANINASAVTHAVITLKNNTANKHMRVFYQTTGTNRYVNVAITANDADFVSYYVDMTGNSDWTGTVNDLTFQFRENSSYNSALDGTIDIDNIEMTSSDIGVNMVNNSSFENWNDDTEATPVDPVGFYKHESVERSSDSHSGDYSIKVIATSTRDLAQTVNEITAGATYRVSINYKLEANTGNGVRLWSTWKDASNGNLDSGEIQTSGYFNTVSNEWATFSVDAVAPENATKMNFEVRAYNGATVYWDSFSVSKVQEPAAQPLLITTSVCSTATSVRLTGPWWGWDPAGGPAAADNGDGTWTFTLDPAPTDNMEYLLVVDGVQENLISIMANGGDCAPVTDNANYANRRWDLGTGDVTNTYGQCGSSCVAPVITLEGTDVTVNNGDTYTDEGATASDDEEGDITANIVVGGDTVDTTTDGTYTITYDVSDGAGNAATTVSRVVTVETPAQPLLITTSVCSTATSVRLTGPWWGWDPAGGPAAADNGDGTWTFTFDPAPTDNMEYLLVVDGVQENLISIMANGGDCAPVTDNANYANRRWDLGTGDVTNTYGQCGSSCVAPVITLTGTDVTINNGYTYTDAGATASDDEEGDITANIVVGGDTVDTDTDGTYTITYDVSDGAGNAATTVLRVVTVETPVPTDTETEGFCESGVDSDPTVLTLTPADITVAGSSTISAISVSSMTIAYGSSSGSTTFCPSWYDATIVVTGGVSDGVSITGCNDEIAGLDLTGFTSLTLTSATTDSYSDDIVMCLDLSVTWELPLVTNDEEFCESGVDSDPTIISLTPSDITVNAGEEITAISISSMTIAYGSSSGSTTFCPSWYDATIVVTGGVSDGVSITGCNDEIAGLDLTGFTSLTLTSATTDSYSDDIVMCLGLSVTSVEPSCTAPTALSAASITATSADISWTAGGTETDYEYVVQAAGTGEPTAAGTAVNGATTVSASGLVANTDYEVYVRSNCGSESSSWTGPLSFTTLCSSITSFPYLESFETITSGQPDCWSVEGTTTTASYHFSSYSTGFTGRGLRFNSYFNSTGRTSELITQTFDASSLPSLQLKFYYKNPSGGDFEVFVSSDFGSTFTSVASDLTNQSDWAEIIIDLSTHISNGVVIKFKGTSNYGSGDAYIYLDEVMLREIPSCSAPTALSAASITTNSAEISWTSDDSSFNIEVVDVTAGGTATGTATNSGVTSPYSLSGLDSNTEYEVYVQTDCGAGETSEWVSLSFTTMPGCGDTVTDSGGSTGNYAANELTTVTVYPDNAGDLVTFTFLSFNTESCCDDLTVYDGPDTSSTVFGTYAGSTIPDPITSSHSTGALTFVFDSDGSLQYGGYEIAISCSPAPSCVAPSALSVASITTNSAEISWTSDDSSFNIEVVDVTAGGTATGTATNSGVTSPYSLSGLDSNTEYEVYVQTDCGAGETSVWAGPVSFTTEPAPIVPNYTNDFATFPGEFWTEGEGALAAGPSGSTSAWLADGFGNSGFTGAARVNVYYSSFSGGNDDWLISPMFDLSSGTHYLNLNVALTAYASTASTTFADGDFVTLMVTEDNGSNWTELYRWDVNNSPSATGDEMPEIDLSSYTSMTKFAFYANSDTSNIDNDFFIDDFQITTTSLGIDEAIKSQFTYFPNPVNDVLTIKAQKAVEDITVFNMLGQVVKQQTPNTMDCTVDLSAMQSGAYFVKVSIGNNVETVRILKN